MNLETRIEIETRLGKETVKALLEGNFLLAVDNGGDSFEVGPTDDRKAILSAMGHTDEEHLYAFQASNLDQPFGSVFLAYGNDGYDLLCDYSVSLEPYLVGVNALAGILEAKHG